MASKYGPNPEDLSTRFDLKALLTLPVNLNTADDTLQRMLSSQSQNFLKQSNLKSVTLQPYREVRNGNGRYQIFLRNLPIYAVDSLTINGRAIPQSPDGIQPGFVNDSTSIMLVQGANPSRDIYGLGASNVFSKGFQNIVVKYRAGYGKAIVETAIVQDGPGSIGTVMGLSQGALWCGDDGVTYDDGTPLEHVDTKDEVDPPGQYTVEYDFNPDEDLKDTPLAIYFFARPDAARTVKISYRYKLVPSDIEQCVLEMAAITFKRKDHIDLKTQGQGGVGTSVSFVGSLYPDSIKSVINQYSPKYFGE